MTLRFCDVYVGDKLVGVCELEPQDIKVGNQIYITGENSLFVIDSFRSQDEDTICLTCERVFTSDVSAVIRLHRSFSHTYKESQTGISPGQAQRIIRLMTEQGYRALDVHSSDGGVITYHVIDSDNAMIDYFYDPIDVIEWLNQ